MTGVRRTLSTQRRGSGSGSDIGQATIAPADEIFGAAGDSQGSIPRVEHERAILRLNRLYSALRQVNQAITRLPSRSDLFTSVCRILGEHGVVRMAWVGWHDVDTHELRPVASWGDETGYLERVHTFGDDRPGGRGPAGIAFREERTFVCTDMMSDLASLPWREDILRGGFRSCASFPVRERGMVAGVLNVYADEEDFFSVEEIALLADSAEDISFSLDNLARETERERAELALRVVGERAQRYLDTAEVILLALDIQGRVTMVNRHACSILERTAEELIGRDFIDICIPPRLRDGLRSKLANVHRGPDSSSVVNAIITRSGKERLIEWNNILLRDDQGNVVSTLSSGTDQTERDEAVNARRIAEERMAFALQVSNVGIWDMDYATGVLTWSETLEAHYGLARGTFEGTFDAFLNRTHPEDRASILTTVAKASKSGDDFTLLTRSIAPDGTERWLSGAGRILLGKHGQPVRGLGVSIDVTERHNLEAQFQQAQKMEAIGRLAGGVAHDFNNLLTAILGYCELLLEDLSPDDAKALDIQEIQKAGKSAAALTRQLLAFSRKEIIQPTVLDLNEVVSNLRGMLGRLIGEDVAIHVGLTPERALIRADRSQIEQVIMNLALNARDSMEKGGTLTIQTAHVELDQEYSRTHHAVDPGHYSALIVSDTGAGMTAEVQARLFEPFFTTKEQGKGTGLGLATVHGIVARSGGSVTVYSEVGTGSSFNVYFPAIANVEQLALRPEPKMERPVQSQTVLVVDDAQGLREMTKRLLERQGYTVLVAAEPKEALRIFGEHENIDVLLTDVVMPGRSGPDLAQQLMARKPALKVVYMSGYTDEAIVHHGVLNPGIALLNKPFTSETLERKLREVLGR